MKIEEAVQIIEKYLPADLVKPVLITLDVPYAFDAHDYFGPTYFVSAEIPVLFRVQAFCEGDATADIQMAVKEKDTLYGAFGRRVWGTVTGLPRIEGCSEQLDDVGDDPLAHLFD
jgi:hypothetical protein